VKYFGVLFAGLVATAFAFQTASQTTTGVSVQGEVLNDGDGQPIRKVSVQLSPRDNSANQFSATTDVDGQFKVDNVKVGPLAFGRQSAFRYPHSLGRLPRLEKIHLGRQRELGWRSLLLWFTLFAIRPGSLTPYEAGGHSRRELAQDAPD
jgi:hypothetical protein